MTSVKTSRGTISFFCVHAKYIHVYEDEQRVAIINSPDPIADVCVEVPSQANQLSPCNLWFVTSPGYVFNIQGLRLLARCDSNKDSLNQEIFTTLLASQLQKKNTAEESLSIVTNTIVVTSQDALFSIDGVLSLCCFRHFLCCCSGTSGAIHLSVYDTRRVIASVHDGETVTPVWTKSVPSSRLDEKGCTGTPLPKTAKLFCLYHDEHLDSLNLELFKALFGEEAVLLNSCILVFSSPSGIIYYFNLKSLTSSSSNTLNPDILCAIGRPCVSVCNLRISHQSVTSSEQLDPFDIPDFGYRASSEIGTLTETASPTSGCNCCALVGDNGKCMLVYVSGDQVQYQTLALPGPVMSCSSAGNIMYLSTEKNLFRCKFNQVTKETGKKCLDVTTTSLDYSRITGLVPIPGSSLGCVKLLCLSSRGRLYCIEDNVHRQRSPAVAGGQMKDLLLAINHTGTELERLKTCIDSQHDILAQSSLASHLASQFMVKHDEKLKGSSKKTKFVNCKVTVKQECLGSNRAVSLVIRLTNESSARLFDCDWSVLVKLTHFEDILRERSCTVCSKSLPLPHGLGSQCYEDLIIPVEGALLQRPILTITAYLIYDPSDIGLNSPRQNRHATTDPQTPGKNDTQTLCVPLTSHEMDILDFLQEPNQNEVSADRAACNTRDELLQNSERSSISDVVMVLANQKPAFQLHRAGYHEEPNKPITTTHSISTTLPTQCLSGSKSLRSAQDVLRLLLSFTGVRLPQDLEGALVAMVTPGGHHVAMDVCMEQSRPGGTSEGISNSPLYTLTLQGEDMASLGLVRAALLNRLEKRKVSVQLETALLEERVAIKTLHQLKGIKKDFQRLQDVSYDKTDTASKSTVELYKCMRKSSVSCLTASMTDGEKYNQTTS